MNAQAIQYPQLLTVHKPEKKTFDLGIYTFHQIMKGELCVDEHKLTGGATLGVLHPLHTVDPSNLYAFVICKNSGQVFQVLRKNLRFKKVITLPYVVQHEEVELHAKYHAAYKFLIDEKKQAQLL